MTEKEMFIDGWDREYGTTMKVLRAFPTTKLDMKPAEHSRSARELAWVFVGGERWLEGILKGDVMAGGENPGKAPSSMNDILKEYEKTHAEILKKVKQLPEEQFSKPIKFPTGPKKLGEIPRNQAAWMTLMDEVHHRGQFSVYLRMAGAKVPSIYGPTADEPWM